MAKKHSPSSGFASRRSVIAIAVVVLLFAFGIYGTVHQFKEPEHDYSVVNLHNLLIPGDSLYSGVPDVLIIQGDTVDVFQLDSARIEQLARNLIEIARKL